MAPLQSLAKVLAKVASEGDPERALDHLTQGVLDLTRSRNAVLTVMNDELGYMELTHGAGRDWDSLATRPEVRVEVSINEGIVGFVAASGGPVVSGDVRAEPLYRKLFESTRSEIAVPIRDTNGRIRGVLNGESDRLDAYSEDDLEICLALASIAQIVLERAQQLKRERALLLVGNALDTALSEPELLDAVLRVASEVLLFQACSIFLLDRNTGTYVLRASIGELKDRIGQIDYRSGEGCTGWVCATGKSIRLASPQGDPRWHGKYLEFPSDQIASFLAVPILSRGHCTGVIRVIRRVTKNPHLDNGFTASDEGLLVAIAEQVASGLENIRSFEKLMRTERMAAWGELSAKSSHMIGNRVFALKGDVNEIAFQLSQPNPSIETLRELAKSLDSSVQRIEEVLQDFRDFVSATQLSTEELDLNALVKETLAEVFPKRAPVKLEVLLDPAVDQVKADSKQLRRAISELVENALLWTAKGTLSVSTSRADEKLIRRAGLRPGREYLAVTIADTGPGVPADKKAAIFQPFHSERVKGMGLGLSIVKGIADAHDGAVVEIGQAGKGARFVILLPALARPNSEGK